MTPTKQGQIVRFHTPLPDEDPTQQYVVLEIHPDTLTKRTQIRPLNTGLNFPPINTVSADDLEVVKVSTNDLIGYPVTIVTKNQHHLKGKAIRAGDTMVDLDMNKRDGGIYTNVEVVILDSEGIEHTGHLLVN